MESFDAVESLLPMGISVFSFDFSGSGLSEGEYISLGYYESQDVRSVVEFLRCTDMVSSISLWGRSMGAASILKYAATDNQISALVIDSPFSTLR
jgi:pimeloyl-ACP methyl ester carboxylesterase